MRRFSSSRASRISGSFSIRTATTFGSNCLPERSSMYLTASSLRGQRVEDVRDRHDARLERDRLALQLVRIARAVPPLMVADGDLRGEAQQAALGVGEHLRAVDRVLLHLVELFGRELGRFSKDRVRDGDLADVVQRRRVADVLGLEEGKPHALGQDAGEAAHAAQMAPRVLLIAILRYERHAIYRLQVRAA
jgi:hypothetical protein